MRYQRLSGAIILLKNLSLKGHHSKTLAIKSYATSSLATAFYHDKQVFQVWC